MTDVLAIGEIFKRQNALFDPQEHQERITILGVGATGSFTALALAKLGVQNIHLWDGDMVEMHNVPNQLHRWSDLGKSKVEATTNIIMDFCQGMDEIELSIVRHDTMFTEADVIGYGVVVCAADSMEARRIFWEKIKMNQNVSLFIDPRVSGQMFHLYCIKPHDPDHIKLYEASFHTDEEADEVPCGERATCDMSFLVAARVVRVIRRFLASSIVEPFTIENAVDLSILQVAPVEGIVEETES